MTHSAFADGNVAVITGAAQGIGRAMARQFAGFGMRVALLDVDTDALAEAAAEAGGETESIHCNVGDEDAVKAAHDRVMERWGQAPSVLVNNAAAFGGRGFDAPLADWHGVVQVNLFGVIHGVRAFLPGMKASGRPGVIVNLGSKQGITNPPGHPVYNLTKAAVKSYTEGLEHDLRQDPDRTVSAHLLIPGWTAGGRMEPKPGAWLPDQVVAHMMAALDRGSFYIVCPDGEVTPEMDAERILWAAGDVVEDRPPLSRWHPDWRAAFDTWRENR